MTLAGRRALVTGATSGIGRAVALALARRGARLALLGRDAARLSEVSGLAREAGAAEALPLRVDLAWIDVLGDVAARIHQALGGLDVLVHAAGTAIHGTVGEGCLEDLDAQLAAHVRGPYRLTQLLLPCLVESRGDLVFVNSSVVSFPRAEVAGYSAAKHALLGLADCLRQEINPHGVRVLSIFPGRTATPGQERLHVLEGRAYRGESLLPAEDVAAAICSALELPRTAEITEIHIRPLQKG